MFLILNSFHDLCTTFLILILDVLPGSASITITDRVDDDHSVIFTDEALNLC
jgi:hypothetical protein